MDLRNQLSAQNHSKKGGSQNYGIISSFWIHYFPIQNFPKIFPSSSSVVTSPVMLPRWCRACLISMAIRSVGRFSANPFSMLSAALSAPSKMPGLISWVILAALVYISIPITTISGRAWTCFSIIYMPFMARLFMIWGMEFSIIQWISALLKCMQLGTVPGSIKCNALLAVSMILRQKL